METEHNERCFFSVELKTKTYVSQLTLKNKTRDGVYFEGFLGEIIDLSFVNGGMLEINGAYGVLRIDISEGKMKKLLFREG